MGFSINHVTVSGNLTRDPESRALPSGTAVTTFSIAYNERRKVNEEWVDVPHFFDITAFGGQGEWLARNIGKGDPVTVSGQLEQQRWEKDGEKRSKVAIVARDIVPGQRGNGGGERQAPAQSSGGYSGGGGYASQSDNDLPY